MQRNYYTIKAAITLVIMALLCLNVSAQNWDVPADKKAKKSYIKFDAVSAGQGEMIYTKNCVSCHGNPGKGNSLKTLVPVPPDLSSVKAQALTDGELFYILVVGRQIMPSFKNILSDEERWKSISYIRSFNKDYVQELSKFDPTKSKLVKINVDFDTITNKLKVDVKADEKAGIIALKDAEVLLFAGRYFGNLQIDKALRTNEQGVAVFDFPKDLPGDKTGNIDLMVKVIDENYGEIEYVNKLKVGVPTDQPSLTEKRAIWNVLAKAPFWIIFLYSSGILFVVLLLLYLVNSLLKLKKLGENIES